MTYLLLVFVLNSNNKQDAPDLAAGRVPLTGRTFNGGMQNTPSILDLVRLVLSKKRKR